MFKPSITVHKSKDGEVKVLVASEDAGKCLQVYNDCKSAGEVVYIRKGYTDKMKKVEDPKLVAKQKKAIAKANKGIKINEAKEKLKIAKKQKAEAEKEIESLSEEVK